MNSYDEAYVELARCYPPQVGRPYVFENGYFFLLVWPTVYTYPVKMVTENASFQKCSRVEIFVNTGFSFTCNVDGRRRKFSNTMMSRHQTLLAWRMLSYFHRFCLFVWTGENDSKTLRVDDIRIRVDGTSKRCTLRKRGKRGSSGLLFYYPHVATL